MSEAEAAPYLALADDTWARVAADLALTNVPAAANFAGGVLGLIRMAD